jgi:hydroxymethylpyrimidine/phosphomethylpyrimidine kinase
MTTCSFASFAGGGLACGGDIEDAVAAANDTPVQMIDTSIVRVISMECASLGTEFSRWGCLAMPQPAPKQQA